jgi:hypothetical protein
MPFFTSLLLVMKTVFFMAALLGCATLSHAQTTPSATPAAATAGSITDAAGTKNVGADRADAPQAPGMQGATPTAPTRTRGSKPNHRSKQAAATPRP